GSGWSTSGAANRELARPRGLAPLQAHAQDAVPVGGIDALRIHLVRQAYGAAELATEALLAVVGCLLLDRNLAFAGYGEQTLLDGDVQFLRVHSRCKHEHLHFRRSLDHIDR